MSRFPKVRPELAARYRERGYWRDQLNDEALKRSALTRPDATAIVDRKGVMSYRELGVQVAAATTGFRKLGIARGDVVSWVLPNWREAAIAHWALVRIGAVSNPIVPIYRHREVGYILGQAQSKAIIVPASFRGFDYVSMSSELRSELASLDAVISVDGGGGDLDFEELCADRSGTDAEPDPARAADDPALLLYTSGTTAAPKGAVHTHNTLDFEIRSIVEIFSLGPDDVVYMPSPLTHVTGLLYGIQMPAVLGGAVVYQDQFDPDAALDLLAEHRCSFTVGATPFLHGLSEAQRKSPRKLALRYFMCGGADVPPELIRDGAATLGCTATRAYGSTEFPTITAGNDDDTLAQRSLTDGRVMDHCEVRVVDEAGNEVAPGVPGELVARGPELFPGYLAGVGADSLDDEGWFRTGDLLSIEDGYLTVAGRIKDIIIRGGENISVKEVEDLLFEHDSVAEVAIVGMPDAAMGERACAYVVPRAGTQPKLRELTDFLRTHRLANQKLPERLELIDELPKTASGKIQKHKLRTRIREQLAQLAQTAQTGREPQCPDA